MFCAPQWHGATQTHFPPRPRKSQWHITNVLGHTVCPHTRRRSDITDVISPHRLPLLTPALKGSFPHDICTTNWPLLSPAPKRSSPHYICTTNWPLLSPSLKAFPALHLYYKLATSHSSSERLFPVLHLYYKLATSESSSKNARTGQIALSPPFRALDTHDLRRGLRAERANSTLG